MKKVVFRQFSYKVNFTADKIKKKSLQNIIANLTFPDSFSFEIQNALNFRCIVNSRAYYIIFTFSICLAMENFKYIQKFKIFTPIR